MVAIVSFCIVIVLSYVTGSVFRKQFQESSISSCLAMLVAMTKSTLVGIVMAIWIPDMVLSTIIAIVFSFLLVGMMTYKLSPKILIESLSALFMGAMMGAMLSLMTTHYEWLSLVFFTIIYIASSVIAIGLWNREIYLAIPSKVIITATLSILLLGASLFAHMFTVSSNEVEADEIEHHH